MTLKFKIFFIFLIAFKGVLLDAQCVESGGAASSSAPMSAEDGDDPRMHVSSVRLAEKEDNWLEDIKTQVKEGYDYLRNRHNYDSLKINTACARLGFLIQQEEQDPILLFSIDSENSLNDPRLCFTSKFKRHPSTDRFEFFSLEDSFEQPRAFKKALESIIAIIIQRPGKDSFDLKLLGDPIMKLEKENVRDREQIARNEAIINGCAGNPKKAARTIITSLGNSLSLLSEVDQWMIRNDPFTLLKRQIEEFNLKINKNSRQIQYLRLCQARISKEWEKKFFHSEQAAYFYFWKRFRTPRYLENFLNEAFPSNFKRAAKVDIIIDVCTHLSMCTNCASSYYLENVARHYYLSPITEYLQAKKSLRMQPRLITRVSSILGYRDDPLPAGPLVEWDQSKVGNLSPSNPFEQ